MTEADLLVEYAMRIDRIWEIIQWWASVTFAVLLAAHVGADSLNRPITLIVLMLYTLFSVFAGQIVWINGTAQLEIRTALESMQEELSSFGLWVIQDHSTALGITMFLTLALTYLSTLFYVAYCYKRRDRYSESGVGT